MPYEYNTLLKLNLQKKADLDPVEADIDDLKQKKVTKFFAATDTLEDGEIAQYQGPDDAVNGLQYGNFYKKNGSETILPAGTMYFPNIDTVNLYGYDVKPGNYYVSENITPAASTNFTSWRGLRYDDNINYLFVNVQFPQVGDSVFDIQNKTVVTVTDIDEDLNITLSDGVYIQTGSSGSQKFTALYNVVDANNEPFTICFLGGMGFWLFVHYSLNGNNFEIVDFFAVTFATLRETTEPTPVGDATFEEVTPVNGIEVDDGTLKISLPAEFANDVTVKGTQTVVKTQEIDSENDNINLRYNNPIALADGEESGVKVLNYDGNNTNCFLGVDNQGWARVGDEDGTLQKLATIEETPTDGQFVKYNTTTKRLESGTIPTPAEATTTTAGLMSAADKVKLDNLSVSAVTSYTKSNSTFKFYKYGRLVNVFCILNVSGSAPISLTIDAAFEPLENVYGYGVPFMTSVNGSVEITGTTVNFIGKGGICLSYLSAS